MQGLKPHSLLPENGFELTQKLQTGFPSPASDHGEKALSLDELIVKRPAATFFVRAEGTAMQSAGIYEGDILVIDRSITAQTGHIVVVSVNEEVLIRRFLCKNKRFFLVSDHPNIAPIPIREDTDWTIWGVATYLVHHFGNTENL